MPADIIVANADLCRGRNSIRGDQLPTLLHISDLHRTSDPRLSNEDILSAILNDANWRWESDGIPKPDLVVVSGDIIQGTGMTNPRADEEIQQQYAEAKEFLLKLAEEFVESDPFRVVIVPGNHDVNWARARNSMQPLDTCPDDIDRLRFDSKAEVRWNWKEQQAYKVVNRDQYQSRFDLFRRFQEEFYSDLEPSPIRGDESDIVYFDYPDLGLAVVGFASWHGNDCFCHVGEIDPNSVAFSRELLATSEAPIAVAVWHHSIIGGPRTYDYMDQRVIHRLVDFGFSVGLHGHRHYPGAVPFQLRLPNLTSMAVVCAGSLAVGDRELPMGERRQFNVVVIEPDNETITVHVRAMSPEGVFTKSHRDDFGGKPYIELPLLHSPSRPEGPSIRQVIDDAYTAVHSREYDRALKLAKDIPSAWASDRRQVKIRAFEGLNRLDDLAILLNPPQSVDEAIWSVSLFLEAGRIDDAENLLEGASEILEESHYNELHTTILARRLAL